MRAAVSNWRQKTLNLSCAQTHHLAASADQTTPKTFFNCDSHVKHLCNDRKFSEAIHILCKNKRLSEAIELLSRIDRPSPAIYSTLLQLCIQQRAVDLGKKVHDHAENNVGFRAGIVICNRLLDLYCKCGCVGDARKVFDEMSERDVCSWNIMVSGYVKAGDLGGARGLFDEMPERDYFSWNAMVSGYVRYDQAGEGLKLFRVMEKNGDLGSSKFVVSSALSACSAARCLRSGKEIHGHIVRTGLDSDEVVWSSLSDMYGKCGSIDDARHIFDKSLNRDVVSWTAMIDRYFEDGRKEEGFKLFMELLSSGIRPNEFTFAGVLNACTSQSAEYLGKQVHGHMIRIGCDPSSFATSTLVHMYSKLGNMENAYRVFKDILEPDLVSWTSLINGYAQNGQPHEALRLFELLLKSGNKPDHVTFIGVLSACTHAGLVDRGLEYFHSIKEKHGLKYTADHYACVVDLLGRSGRFKEAEDIIVSMPMKPDKFLWASLLGGCRIHGNIELAKRAAEALFQIEPDNPATYVTLANIYATAGKWDEVAKLRKVMNDKGVVKKPGISWTEIKGKVHTFMVGDKSHPYSTKIYDYLSELFRRMKEEGYNPETDYVLHDVEDEQKEQNIFYHSEKLAVAFGIIATPQGTTIKVFKNLRTCVDCHTSFKYISKIVKRKIIVRDSTRFHCFEGGSCSCKDYW
ncbi:hypothetical protein DCAR_0100564 [Daucus carota subsp. sativus]|uniref:DYW domain-containing protein n=1 Tax=Daucus carota subsp. sativus TaxID=79200 RepID=A0AAF0W184_DAUCS|nr:hypothetical protein DCAR_0100564 [Daucus carota subsp. sativus]